MYIQNINVLLLISILSCLALLSLPRQSEAKATVLMRVCDPREIKTVTDRVCMLYKRNKNSDLKVDKLGNVRVSRSSDKKSEFSPARLAAECCKVGCEARLFAANC